MGSAAHTVKNKSSFSAQVGADSAKISQQLSRTTSQLKRNALNNVEIGAKSCPIVNEASNMIGGISKGDRATAL